MPSLVSARRIHVCNSIHCCIELHSALKCARCQEIRTRPTRDDTRDKLFEAAARVFEEQGINAASIETIAAAAGFTRGAFYSNFASKDELIVAMLEDHVEQSIRRNLDLLARHQDLQDYLDAYRKMDRSRQDPLGHAPLLHMEMILFVARAEKRRPELAKRLRARRQMLTEIVAIISKHEARISRTRHGSARSCSRWRTASACIA